MCEPVMLGTAAATSALPTLIGGAGMGTMFVGTTSAATAGLFGAGGVFSWGSTLNTLGTLGSGLGQLYSGSVASANATYQGQMAEYQAALDENSAIMALQAADYEADIMDDRRKRFIASKDAKTGKSGTVIADGSNLETTINSYEEFTAERLAVLYKGQVSAAASRAGAKGQQFAAKNAYQNATRAETGSYMNAATTIGEGAYRGGLLG